MKTTISITACERMVERCFSIRRSTVTTFARATFRELAVQYFRYGHWKAQMVKLHPRSIRVRHLVAPAFVSSLVVFGLLSFFWLPARVGPVGGVGKLRLARQRLCPVHSKPEPGVEVVLHSPCCFLSDSLCTGVELSVRAGEAAGPPDFCKLRNREEQT